MDNQLQRAQKANIYVEKAIINLIKKFKGIPTVYLEERHIHNDFGMIIKGIVPNNEQITTTRDGIPFPVIMNEYTTVNHYKRNEKDDIVGFENVYNEKGEGSPGSLDYVYLDSEWIKTRDYDVAVNKNSNSRIANRSENRYLSTGAP